MKVDRNKRVTLQKPQEGAGSYGETSNTFVDVATVYASVEPLSGREFFTALQAGVIADVNHRVRVEYSSLTKDAGPSWRVLYGTRLFDIVSVIDYKEQHNELQLMCREQVTR